MKIAHRKAQTEVSRAFQASYFQWALATNMFRRVPLRLSGVPREVQPWVPKKGQPVNAVGELIPPTSLALDVEVVRFRPQETPRELPRREEYASLLGEFFLVNTKLCLHRSLLSRALKAKGRLLPLRRNFEQKLIYIYHTSRKMSILFVK